MSTVLQLVHALHLLNGLLIGLTAVWALAVLLFRLFRERKPELRSALRVLVGSLYLQGALGLLIFGLSSAQLLTLFHGHGGLRHMGGGALAALLGAPTLWQSRQPTRPWLAPLCCALIFVTVVLVA